MTGDEAGPETDDGQPVDAGERAGTLENGTNEGAGATEKPPAGTGLERVRTEPRLRRGALVLAVVVGIALTWLHWLGLLVGGALVGLVSRTLSKAVGAAVVFGVLVLIVFALTLGESVWPVLEMAPVSYLVVAAALGIPILGSLVRGVF